MLATIIVEKYSLSEAAAVAEALDMICSPKDTYGWSSSGIYCFWHPVTKEVLYIGLAMDLPMRFRQHNGLVACEANCCKWEKVQAHFAKFPELGYSIMVQSSLSQGICSRWSSANPETISWITERFELTDDATTEEILNVEVDESIRLFEGTLLEAVSLKQGRLPAWNRIQGARLTYQPGALKSAEYVLKSLVNDHPNNDPLSAHVRLRELAGNPTFVGFEEFLHTGRLHMLTLGVDSEKAFQMIDNPLRDEIDRMKRIRSDAYLSRIVKI